MCEYFATDSTRQYTICCNSVSEVFLNIASQDLAVVMWPMYVRIISWTDGEHVFPLRALNCLYCFDHVLSPSSLIWVDLGQQIGPLVWVAIDQCVESIALGTIFIIESDELGTIVLAW